MKFLNTFKLFESVSEQEKIESIDSFDEYLREIFHEDHPIYMIVSITIGESDIVMYDHNLVISWMS